MKRSTYLIPAIALTLALSACGSTQPQTLSEKLEGKTPEEKQEVLRLACLNEADYTTYQKKAEYRRRYSSKRANHIQDTEETKRLKTLCREMTENYLSQEK